MASYMFPKIFRQGCRGFSRRNVHRKFCSSSNVEPNITKVSLKTRPDSIQEPVYAAVVGKKHETQVTTLDNGLRVASENHFGQFCTVGVIIDSGSRYEVNFPSGISHFLEKLAFGKTTEYESRDHIHQELEKIGGICDCQGSRDAMIYAMSAETRGLSTAIRILSEVVNRPEISDQELEVARQTIQFELESYKTGPNPEVILTEMIFAAAYRNNTLGLPKMCQPDNIGVIDSNILYTYLKNFYDPSRMVLAGVGMEHDELVRLAEEYFVNKPAVWTEERVVLDPTKTRDDSLAQYTGGIVKEEADLSNVSVSVNPMPDLAHFVIGLESCSHQSDDFVAVCVLNMLMGGGGSFSAGGPGKGMYSRLYLNVLHQYHWIDNATAYNHAFSDTGMFCINASAPPDKLQTLTEVILHEFSRTAHEIRPDELNRAKTQLQSMLMMNLEQRPIVFEDIARQTLSSNERKQPEHFYDLIGAVTADDVRRVAGKMLKTKPSVAAYGNLKQLPSIDNMQSMLLGKYKTDKSNFSRAKSWFGS